MPVCEKCQTPYDAWQHFCLNCGHYLRDEPPPTRRCPQCGRQAALDQNFCPECAAPLKEEAAFQPPSSPSRRWLVGMVAALAGLGVILALYLSHWPGAPQGSKGQSQTRVVKVDEEPTLKDGAEALDQETMLSSVRLEIEEVLDQIKEANLTKNILLYMGTLSALYPQLDKKRQEVSTTWEKFDFQEMNFTVETIKDAGHDTVVAKVNWRTRTQNLATKGIRTDNLHYRVWFAQELGQWKIKKIEEL
jgi:hypothetical protein